MIRPPRRDVRWRGVEVGNIISAATIANAYCKAFKISWWQRSGIFFFADKKYREVDENVIAAVLAQDKTDAEEYVEEWFDCDDFAFSLMGMFHKNEATAAMPIFITWVLMPGGGHAVLSYYKAGKVCIIEPQNDEIYPVPKNWKLLLLCG